MPLALQDHGIGRPQRQGWCFPFSSVQGQQGDCVEQVLIQGILSDPSSGDVTLAWAAWGLAVPPNRQMRR